MILASTPVLKNVRRRLEIWTVPENSIFSFLTIRFISVGFFNSHPIQINRSFSSGYIVCSDHSCVFERTCNPPRPAQKQRRGCIRTTRRRLSTSRASKVVFRESNLCGDSLFGPVSLGGRRKTRTSTEAHGSSRDSYCLTLAPHSIRPFFIPSQALAPRLSLLVKPTPGFFFASLPPGNKYD